MRTRTNKATRAPHPTGKTAGFLALVEERYGPLADFPLAIVSRVSGELALKVGLHAGSARTALKAAVLAAADETPGQ